MKVVTWNLFMESPLLSERIAESLKVLRVENPDVICLQEVHQRTITSILDILSDYHLPARDVQLGRVADYRYSTLTFTRDHTSTCVVIPFQRTSMHRDILQVTVGVIKIVNVHLESTNQPRFRATRMEQLTTLHTMYAGVQVVVCGDFNINGPVTSEGFREIPLEGPTFYAARFNDSDFEARFDHVLYSGVECQLLHLVGAQPYSEQRYCSDHDGIAFAIHH